MAFSATIFIVSIFILEEVAAASGLATPAGGKFPKFTTEKKTHLHFFLHDTLSRPNTTAINVVSGPPSTAPPPHFGDVFIFDDPVTEGPNLTTSKLIGRGQGMYLVDSLENNVFLFTINLVLTKGKFNGSSLTMIGRDAFVEKVRELSVVGGTGKFRLARGYALITTTFFNPSNGDAILEFNVQVLHHH